MRRFEEVADRVRQRIQQGVLREGDRLPSVRQMSFEAGCSIETVCRAYADLVAMGLVRSEPRSGFYVRARSNGFEDQEDLRDIPDLPRAPESRDPIWQNAHRVLTREGDRAFGSLQMSGDIFMSRQMVATATGLSRAVRQLRTGDVAAGGRILRESIQKRLAHRGVTADPEDIVIVRSFMHGIRTSLEVIATPGDTILIETPSLFPQIELLRRTKFNVMEIYSHPHSGISPSQLEHLLSSNSIAACILTPVHHYPTGITYRPDIMRSIVEIAYRHGVPIIENEMHSELAFKPGPAPSLKAFDPHGIVLQCSSLASTLGPGWSLGWIVNSRHREALAAQSFYSEPDGTNDLIQMAIGEYLLKPIYITQIRRIRTTLSQRVRQGMLLLSKHFPESCTISQPDGGFMCWVRGPLAFDATKTAEALQRQGITIAPGPLFSITNSFRNYIGLNLSFPWTAEREGALRALAHEINQSLVTSD